MALWFVVGVFIVSCFGIVSAGAIYVFCPRRKSRLPVPFKLLRSPGETLRRKIVAMDDDMAFKLFVLSLLPLIAALLAGALVNALFPQQTMAILTGAGVAFLLFFGVGCYWMIRFLKIRRNLKLGYLAERAVGEHLDELRSSGFRIFHDVPAKGARKSFNLDHVVVGATGVFLIETKARRKGVVRPGFKDHEVISDGQKLVWPWGEDVKSIEQAQNEAVWLAEWLKTMTGLTINVRPILALPGWFVDRRGVGGVAVLNQKNLVGYISKPLQFAALTAESVDLISRQLDSRCRDVED